MMLRTNVYGMCHRRFVEQWRTGMHGSSAERQGGKQSESKTRP